VNKVNIVQGRYVRMYIHETEPN